MFVCAFFPLSLLYTLGKNRSKISSAFAQQIRSKICTFIGSVFKMKVFTLCHFWPYVYLQESSTRKPNENDGKKVNAWLSKKMGWKKTLFT